MPPTHRLSTPDLLIVGVYLAAITVFGLSFRSKSRSLKGYFLADRQIAWWAIALSIVAAETSTLTIISVPGLAFTGDWGFLQIVLGYLLGRIVVCLLFLPRYFRGELLTAYEVIGQRFGPRLHKLTAFSFLFLRAGAEGVRVFAVSIAVGIDVLEADHFAELATLASKHDGKLRIGLLTNQTGLDAQGHRTIDVLAHDAEPAVPGLKFDLLFSPEHGINGTLDKEGIANSTDPATGLPVISLYGASTSQRRPPLETLRGLDAVVIDLADAGVRFYTYETVVRYFLEAAHQTGTEIIILDRPNPLGGSFVQGPVSDVGKESYVDVAPIPIRHGLTLGELARFLNGEYKLHAPLTVVAMKGWQRGDWFDATGLA